MTYLHPMTLNRIASTLVILIAIVVILIYGQSLLIPFVFAALLWILVREIKQWMDKVQFIKERIPSWLKSLFITFLILLLFGTITEILINSTRSLARSYATYQSNVVIIVQQIEEWFDIDVNEMMLQQRDSLNFTALFSSLLNSLTSILSSAFMILIYALFIFLEEANFSKKLTLLFSTEEKYEQVVELMERMEDSITKYLGLKVLTSAMTGIISYFILILIGVEGPAFWAFLIFLLNFIPTIGSIIATLFPAVFAVLQFGEIVPGGSVLLFVGLVQVVIGNIIEPRFMGNSLNLSSLVAILSLMFWGSIWGVIGMLLSIPITVILVIVLSQFETTRPVAILLSKDGKLN